MSEEQTCYHRYRKVPITRHNVLYQCRMCGSEYPGTVESNIRTLYVLLKLRDDSYEEDSAIVESLKYASWFSHVMLVTLSWQERPDAVNHYLVRRAVEMCHLLGIPFIWGRWLWVAWPGSTDFIVPKDAHFLPRFYAAAVGRLKGEAKALGAVGTMLDVEPYGNCEQKKFKEGGVTDDDRVKIQAAIDDAVRVTEGVTFLRPTSSAHENHYAWAMTNLGEFRMDSKTYYTKHPNYNVPPINPPEGHLHRMDLWGSNVGNEGDTEGKYEKVTAADVKALDMVRIKELFPECCGLFIYADHKVLTDVLEAFGGVGD